MTYNNYRTLVGEAKNLPTEEKFIGEVGYPADEPLDTEDFLKVLHIIYTVANENFLEIFNISGLKLSVFSRKFNIPYRTLQGWKWEERKTPEYILQMIGYIMVIEYYEKVTEEM